jgi:hypothetical protein
MTLDSPAKAIKQTALEHTINSGTEAFLAYPTTGLANIILHITEEENEEINK